MKKTLLLIAVCFSVLNCQQAEEEIAIEKDYSTVKLFDRQRGFSTTYDVVINDINLTSTKSDGFTKKTLKEIPALKNYSIKEIDISIENKTLIIKDDKGDLYEFNLTKNEDLIYQEANNNVIYSLTPKIETKSSLGCRVACYALFAVMISADGPSPICDVLAAAALGECLHACEQTT